MAHIFISYATPDRAIADEVSGWLRGAGHEPFLDHDLRDGISLGEDWKQRLYRELRRVDAVVGVVTKSFVASEWCFAELGIADARGCRLVPLRAEAGVVHPLMQDLQYVDYHTGPQQARDRVLQAVRLLDDGGGAWQEGDNPFPGLEPFTAALSQVFFGRAAEAREVGNRLRTMGGTGGMLAIVGPSGCGRPGPAVSHCPGGDNGRSWVPELNSRAVQAVSGDSAVEFGNPGAEGAGGQSRRHRAGRARRVLIAVAVGVDGHGDLNVAAVLAGGEDLLELVNHQDQAAGGWPGWTCHWSRGTGRVRAGG